MYITVMSRDRTERYSTKFECNECMHCNRCSDAEYKINCKFYDHIRPNFRISYQVPYLTTGQPRLVYINLDSWDSLEKARNVIESAKRDMCCRNR